MIDIQSDRYIPEGITHRKIAIACITYLGFDCFNQSLHDHEIEANVLNGEYALQDYAEVNWFHHCKVGISLAISKDQCSELADSVSRFIQLRGGIDSLGQWDNRTMSKSSFAILRKQYPDLSNLLMELENTSSTGPPGAREYQLILNISSGGRLTGIKQLQLFETSRRIREIFETTIASLWTSSNKECFYELKQFYGEQLFKCPHIECTISSVGFTSYAKAVKHKKVHQREFRCEDQSCGHLQVVFSSLEDLNEHVTAFHSSESTQLSTAPTSDAIFSTQLQSMSDDDRRRMLFDAAEFGPADIVRQLVCFDFELMLSVRNQFGASVLHVATEAGHTEVLSILLRSGAAVEARDFFGNTPLHLASCAGQIAAMQALFNYGASTKALDVFGNTPVHIASISGQEAAINLLVKRGADVDTENYQSHTPLFYAYRNGYADITAILRRHTREVAAPEDYPLSSSYSGSTRLSIRRLNRLSYSPPDMVRLSTKLQQSLSCLKSRYFIAKSVQERNITTSFLFNVWSTSQRGLMRLDNAFNGLNDGRVILIFSVSKRSVPKV